MESSAFDKYDGPKVWCWKCQKPVEVWTYTQDSERLYVMCHGEKEYLGPEMGKPNIAFLNTETQSSHPNGRSIDFDL